MSKHSKILLFILPLLFLAVPSGAAEDEKKFTAKIQSCNYVDDIDGLQFQADIEVKNTGDGFDEPLVVWLIYGDTLCDHKILTRAVAKDEALFADDPEGKTFKCGLDPAILDAREAAAQNVNLKVVYAHSNIDPRTYGTAIWAGSTSDYCGK